VKRYRDIETLRADHQRIGKDVRARLTEFAAVPREEWFMELAYCLLTPQSSARSASRAIAALRNAGYPGTGQDPIPDPAPLLKGNGYYIRFHHTKARRLLEAAARREEIVSAVAAGRGSDGRDLRAWMAGQVKGLGWKEASHFLRNIGFRDLAILDRHILRNLRRHGVIRSVPAALTPKRYLVIERAFLSFARAIGIPMDELDLLFWSRETGEILK
jgi:N-glycosylase/DNA lyase